MKLLLGLFWIIVAFNATAQRTYVKPVADGSDYFGVTVATNTLSAILGGSTGNQVVPVNTTVYLPLNNSFTNFFTTDASGGTRMVCPKTTLFTNLYVVASASMGGGKTTTVTLMTNGVASDLVASLTATTTGNDTTHGVTVLAGWQVGLKITTQSASTPVKYCWGIEAQ
jgi:hypothetical protein